MATVGKSDWNFCSDNVAPVAPEILAAMGQANQGNISSYGEDPWTEALTQDLRRIFEKPDLIAFPVATGTAANALAVSTMVPPYGGIICTEDAHINTDECGAPEFFSGGAKLLSVPSPDSRLSPAQITARVQAAREHGVHVVQPHAVSITQSTEWGAVYGLDQLRAIGDVAASHKLGLHMDGARFANALVHIGCSPAEMTWKAGMTSLSFGATKNGAMAAEAVIFFNPAQARGFAERRKRAAHLWSKQRFMSAQLLAYLKDDLWLRNARHANAVAQIFAHGLAAIPGVRLLHEVQANEAFVVLPEGVVAALEGEGFGFYRWHADTAPGEVAIRLVTSYASAPEAAQALVSAAARFGNR
ncbi:low specificity L-threonine aldolase [Acidisoma cellulosilytica]|uniref:L-threonine aldolase n=1 Tax=Acidisoma cellulosilyticum TaxID=2802395 RepID=A0A963Z151_9PROT|nr:low specificity L-threonine aldolase [Acidisoma cellulosilyticum]MCB8879893.1 low specificity L-threonine aldolase [Acidisoma cellulosilyticum]